MATLYGQNFRILTYDSTASKFKVVGMATNCTVNLNTNTDDASTKDDVGRSSKPEIVSKSWQVSVDSLSVADVGTLMTAMKNNSTFTLLWDEVATTDNQSVEQAAFARSGVAYLTDATFQFDDRTNATKSLQFTGIGGLSSATPDSNATISAGSYTKGQYVRLFLGEDNTTTPTKVIAAPKSLSLHISVSLEDATTKDTDGSWTVQEPTGISYDISTSALVRSGDTIASGAPAALSLADLQEIYNDAAPVKWQIANTSGANNRTKGAVICSGSVILASLSISAQNRSVAKYDATLNGWGDYTVGA